MFREVPVHTLLWFSNPIPCPHQEREREREAKKKDRGMERGEEEYTLCPVSRGVQWCPTSLHVEDTARGAKDVRCGPRPINPIFK